MKLYVVTVNGRPQQLADHGFFLVGCAKDPTLFTRIGLAEQAAQKTLRYAEDKDYFYWSIVQSGYQIYSVSFKLVSDEAKPVDEEGRNHLKEVMRGMGEEL